MENRIKILLASYVNYPNAQNINCDNIAKHLDKNKFDVHVLYLGGKPMDVDKYKNRGITPHYVNQHRYLHQLTLKKALVLDNYDIYYMPKLDQPFLWFADRFGDKRLLVSSIEGVITEHEVNEEHLWYQKFMLQDMYDVFSISNCIKNSVQKYYNKNTDVLPLGVRRLKITESVHTDVKNIIWSATLKQTNVRCCFFNVPKNFPSFSLP